MKFYPEDYSVELVIGFTDLNGTPVTPTEVSAILYDGNDEEIVDFGAMPFAVADGSKTVIVPAQFNCLADGELRAARILRIALVTEAGVIRRSFSYVIESEQRLELMTNTFMSYEAAELLMLDVPNATGWTTASEDAKKAALIEAFRRLTMIPMRFTREITSNIGWDTLAPRDIHTEYVISRAGWLEVDQDTYSEFPSAFKKALRRAQAFEAAELLSGDSVLKKHRAGIVTETIGESSVTLRSGKVDLGVSSTAMSALAGYIYFNARIARA